MDREAASTLLERWKQIRLFPLDTWQNTAADVRRRLASLTDRQALLAGLLEQRLLTAVDSLQRDIDSLQKLRQRIRSDPATQERIAREAFGMVRGEKELLYRFVDPDSLARRR